MLHHAWRAVSGALRMRRSRECRRQGHVKASLEVASGATTDLVALGWLTCPDRVDKDALACATRAYRAGNRDVCNTLGGVGGRLLHTRSRHRGFAHRNRIVSDCPAVAEPRNSRRGRRPPATQPWGRPQRGSRCSRIVDDKPPGARPFDEVDSAPPSTTSPFADTAVEPTQPFEVDSVEFCGLRLDSYQRWRIWAPDWGPRPDQDGCLAPDCLL